MTSVRVAPALIAGEEDWRWKSFEAAFTNLGSVVRLLERVADPPELSDMFPEPLQKTMLFFITGTSLALIAMPFIPEL